MNVIDKIVAVVSPRAALGRVQYRRALAAYDAARPNRTHKAKRSHGSGDHNAQRAGLSLREQARSLEENSDFVDGLLGVLVNNVVGREGIGVEPMPLTYAGDVHEGFAKQILSRWERWSLKADSTGKHSRAELERLACRTWLRDGEVFGEHIMGRVTGFKHPSGGFYSIQAMEPDFFPFELSVLQSGISGAIERNAWGQPVFYHAYLNHPGDSYAFSTKTRSIPADRMMHLMLAKRLHQGRGVTILASSMQRISGLQNYEESELVAARIAAAMAFYIKKGEGAMYTSDDGDDEEDVRRTIPISPGTVFDDLKPGEDVGVIDSKRPNALLETFRDAMSRMVCAATGANASTVNKKYDGTFSSQRQELVESYVSYGVMSNQFISQWSRPVYRNWLRMEILSGLDVPADVDPDSIFSAYYQCPMMPWIDPQKEAKGFNDIVRGGFGTESEVIRSRGKNPQEVKRQRAREIKENRELDLVFASDAQHEYYGVKNETESSGSDKSDGGSGDDAD